MGHVPLPPFIPMSKKEADEARFRREITPPTDWLTPVVGWIGVLAAIALVWIVVYLAFEALT